MSEISGVYESTQTDHDHVFHLSSTDTIDISQPLELRPNPDRGDKEAWRVMEEFVDARRPEHIARLGISRRNAVFAYPTCTPINNEFSWGKWPSKPNLESDRRIAIGIKVNPRDVIVCEAQGLDSGIVKWAHLSEENQREAEAMADQYWANAIPLDEFRRIYDTETYSGLRGVQKALMKYEQDEPEQGYLLRYEQPEVLVPGPIPSESLYLAAMGIHHQNYIYTVLGPKADAQVAA